MELDGAVDPDGADGLDVGGAGRARDQGHGGREAVRGVEQGQEMCQGSDDPIGGDDRYVDWAGERMQAGFAGPEARSTREPISAMA